MELIDAGPDREELLLDLMAEFYASEHLVYDREVASRALRDLWTHPVFGRIYFIAVEGEPVGYVALTFGFSLEFQGRDALVDELYIREGSRRLGLGSACLQKLDDICRAEGVRALHLEVDRGNLMAKAWYHRMGFEDHNRHLLTRWLIPPANSGVAPKHG